MNKYYTYLIGWSKHNLWYYGVRYSMKADPSQLWKTYFTSSKVVARYRIQLGEPDIIQVRRTFDSPEKAKLWEERVLNRLNVRSDIKWLNLSQPNSFKGVYTPWNKGLTKDNCVILKETSLKISKSRKGQVGARKGYKYSETEKDNNSWSQIKKKVPFINYNDFKSEVKKMHSEGCTPNSIATYFKLDLSSIKRALGVNKLDQSWSKIKKRHPNFKFNNYNDFALYCQHEININGRKRWSLVKELQLSEDAIKRALNHIATTTHSKLP